MMALMHTLLPEPVVPASSMCGMDARSATMGPPSASLPRYSGNCMLSAASGEAVPPNVWAACALAVVGAVVLGLGRALGETMAVTMLIGNRHEISLSLVQPGYTIAAAIANEFAEAVSGLHLAALVYCGLVLFVITVLVNAAARWLIWRVARGSAAGSAAI